MVKSHSTNPVLQLSVKKAIPVFVVESSINLSPNRPAPGTTDDLI